MKLIYAICFWICFHDTVGDDNRIIGGRLAKVGEFPYQVSIRISFNDAHICGGSIITPRFVLTAAHCVTDEGFILPAWFFSVIAGELTLSISKSSVSRNISGLIVHDYFNHVVATNDIALAKLQRDLPSNNKLISPIQLNRKTINSGICSVTGWGITHINNTEPNENLMVAEVHIVDYNKCLKSYNKTQIRPGMMCAGPTDNLQGSCKGDSGGPLVCNGLLVGVVSWGRGCAINPGIYSDVAHYVPWMRQEKAIT